MKFFTICHTQQLIFGVVCIIVVNLKIKTTTKRDSIAYHFFIIEFTDTYADNIDN